MRKTIFYNSFILLLHVVGKHAKNVCETRPVVSFIQKKQAILSVPYIHPL